MKPWNGKKKIQHYFENPYFEISIKRMMFFTKTNGQKYPKTVLKIVVFDY